MIRLKPSFDEYVPAALAVFCFGFIAIDYATGAEDLFTVVMVGLGLHNLNKCLKERDKRKAAEKRINIEWQKERDAFFAALRKHMHGE